MKIVLRQVRLGEYVDYSGGWTPFVSEAQNFALASDAVEFCQKRDLKGMELVMTSGDPSAETRVPLERVRLSADGSSLLPYGKMTP